PHSRSRRHPGSDRQHPARRGWGILLRGDDGMTERKRIAILGSTGSIGRQTLDVIAWHADRFEVVGLAARQDAALFREQVRQFTPRIAALTGADQDGWSPPATRLCFGD